MKKNTPTQKDNHLTKNVSNSHNQRETIMRTQFEDPIVEDVYETENESCYRLDGSALREYKENYSIGTHIMIRKRFPNKARDLMYLLDFYRLLAIQQIVRYQTDIPENQFRSKASPKFIAKQLHLKVTTIRELNKLLEKLNLIHISYAKKRYGGRPITTIRLLPEQPIVHRFFEHLITPHNTEDTENRTRVLQSTIDSSNNDNHKGTPEYHSNGSQAHPIDKELVIDIEDKRLLKDIYTSVVDSSPVGDSSTTDSLFGENELKQLSPKPTGKVSYPSNDEVYQKSCRAMPQKFKDSPALLSLWEDWFIHRKEMGKKKQMTWMSAKHQIEMLSQLTVDEAIQSLETSIQAGWTGLFPPKKQTSNGYAHVGKPKYENPGVVYGIQYYRDPEHLSNVYSYIEDMEPEFIRTIPHYDKWQGKLIYDPLKDNYEDFKREFAPEGVWTIGNIKSALAKRKLNLGANPVEI
jgi:hypothetical protein